MIYYWSKNEWCTPFPKQHMIKSTVPGEQTHTDVWGPSHKSSVGNAKYYLLCVDNYSQYVTIYFMKEKWSYQVLKTVHKYD